MKLSEDELLYLKAKDAYYNTDEPIMEDWEFDELEAKLIEDGSPAVEMVGYKTQGVIVKHLTPMKSLNKIQFQHGYTPLKEFAAWRDQAPLEEEYEGSPKFDGNGVNLIYYAGKLQKASTRGDSVEGQDITAKMKLIVPNTITIDKRLEIRGEVVIKVKTFNEKYGPGTELNKKNARNFVAGILARDNVEKDIMIDLDFAGFEIKTGPQSWMSHPFDNLKHWGFMDIFHRSYYGDQLRSEYHLNNMHETWAKYREECPYQLDGWVLKMGNHLRTPDMEKEKYPKWALAIKFPAKIGRTIITGIDWALGSTGALIPVALLKPVDLDGSTVSRVTLHNYEWATERNLGIGAEIEIVKSGDIIPKVHKVLKTGEDLKWPGVDGYYKGCEIIRDGVHLKVKNPEGLPEFKAKKLHQAFVILGMKGIGPAMALRLVEAGYPSIIEIFGPQFNKKALIETGSFVDGRELEILLEIVDNVKEIEAWKILACLKFDGVGRTISKEITNFLYEVDYDFSGLEKAIVEEWTGNAKTANQAKYYFFRGVFQAGGRKMIAPEKLDLANVGGFFEMTGSPKEHGFKVKADFLNLAASKGYVHSKLDKNCNFLLTDDMNSTSSKMAKAAKLGVEIITYSDFAAKHLA